MTGRKRSPRVKLGDFIEIKLKDGSYAFGRILEKPLMAFYDLNSSTPATIETIEAARIAFRIWVGSHAVAIGGWRILGNKPPSEDLLQSPCFSKFDRVTGRYSLYRDGQEVPASRKECLQHEVASVWSYTHVESRLYDHFHGLPNLWVEAMKERLMGNPIGHA